eukprot:TRINITY_DN5011_c0_g1_i1.p1 TRINITY_DN5011_c0_g1~~TRINITY_DN5011_c0_g1_i1.p1  ORF type:complete len:194 (-),score=27.85 TRINITY_DN5011_c0_g1_i1:287-868(-)
MGDSVLDEECEALESILEDKFTRLDNNSIRIVVDQEDSGDDGQHPIYLVMKMQDDYPESIPEFDLSNMNNVVFPQYVRDQIQSSLQEQAQDFLGDMMVYNLVEFVRDNLVEYNSQILKSQVEEQITEKPVEEKPEPSKKVEKESQARETDNMTKAQKRRYYDKFGTADKEKPRGWNWVDIISHLSQRPAPPRA